ncbi:MAG: FtsX-like permease family protein [Rhodothermales bacterium]
MRYLGRHPWLTGLSVLGIALGVAVVVSIDLANTSAQRAFELSASRVVGAATHQVVAPERVDGSVYRMLRIEMGIRAAAPVVEGYAVHGGRTYQVLGIDPFADGAFRPYATNLPVQDLGIFVGPDPVVLAAPALGAEPGDTLHLSVAGSPQVVTLGGLLVPDDESGREAAGNLIVADVGTAQRLFGMGDALSRIDLVIETDRAGASATARIEAALPEGVRLVRSSERTEAVNQMTDAFELNLHALSLLALVVAMFLIYNTITFSVVQRRALLGRLRAIGVTRRGIFLQVLFEAALMGTAGAVVGLALGAVLAQGLVRLVTQTINDLYYVLEVRSVVLDPLVIGKAALLGVVATALAAVPAAYEASSSSVHVVLQRSEEERRMRRVLPALTWAAVAVAVAAVVVLLSSGASLFLSYVGLSLVLLAFALITPAATCWIARGARQMLGRPFGLVGRMAAQGVVHHLSRTSVAIAALSIAVAAAVGVGVMVGSFRDTVTDWLDYTLQADLYVQAPGSGFPLGRGVVDANLVPLLEDVPGIRHVSSIRRMSLALEDGTMRLAAIDPGPDAAYTYRYTRGEPEAIWDRFTIGRSVLVSEPLAYRKGLAPGDSLELPTDRGPRSFLVAGVFFDYASDQGTAVMLRSVFTRHFDAEGLSGVSLYLEPDASPESVADQVRALIGQDVIVRSNRALREASIEVFDRTFAITSVLRVLALLVAGVGIVSALMALQIERATEFAILRAEGMTPGVLRKYVTLQTGIMGAIAGMLAVPLGLVLAYVLVFVINKRSFGWTLQFTVPADALLQAFGLALAAAIVAGIYPALTLERKNTADALREE